MHKDEVANLLYYIYNEGNLNDPEYFFAFLHQKFSKDVEEQVMTLGQKARHEAMQQGMQQGKLKQAEETALFLLKENMEVSKVAQATNLSIDIVIHLAEIAKNAH